MIIHRVLTNNAVIVNENGKESIVCGKGIAYKKKPGQEIDKSLINQTFILIPDSKIQLQLEQLITNIPLEYIGISYDIVKMSRLTMEITISDSLIISLADHIYETIRRHKDGINISNGLIWDIQRFYENEYEVGLLAKSMIEKSFDIELPNDEAAYIAMHIINAETNGSTIDETMKMTKLIQDIIRVVRMFFGITFDEKSGYYYRFITHLKYFSKRILRGEQFTSDENKDLEEIIFEKYKDSYNCACKIGEFVENKLNYHISSEEMMYITIHIQSAVIKGTQKDINKCISQ